MSDAGPCLKSTIPAILDNRGKIALYLSEGGRGYEKLVACFNRIGISL